MAKEIDFNLKEEVKKVPEVKAAEDNTTEAKVAEDR